MENNKKGRLSKAVSSKRRKVTIRRLLAIDDLETVFAEASEVPDLLNVVIITDSAEGQTIFTNMSYDADVICTLETAKTDLVMRLLCSEIDE